MENKKFFAEEQDSCVQKKFLAYLSAFFLVFFLLKKLDLFQFSQKTGDLLFVFLPISLVFGLAGLAYWKKQISARENFRKNILFNLNLALLCLAFYFLYSPESFIPFFVSVIFLVRRFFTLESFFFFFSRLSLLIVSFSLALVFLQFYQKNKKADSFLGENFSKKILYGNFFFLIFIFALSFASFPRAYQFLTEPLAEILFDFSGEKTVVLGASSEWKRFQKVRDFSHSLAENLFETKEIIKKDFQTTTENLALDFNQKQIKINQDLIQVSGSLKEKIEDDVSEKLSVSGGIIEGDLVVQDELELQDSMVALSIQPKKDGTYDLGTSENGWNKIYVSHLVGSSPITIGTNSSNYSLIDDNDLIISGDLEVQENAYLKNLNISGQLTLDSQSLVNNLNADYLDGHSAEYFQRALTDPVTGSGSQNQLVKFVGENAVGSSVIYDNGLNVGIGVTNPKEQLDLSGNLRLVETNTEKMGIIYKNDSPFIHDFNYGNNGTITTLGQNLFIGKNAGNFSTGQIATAETHSSLLLAIGENSLSSVTTGYKNLAIGVNALSSVTTGNYNISIGWESLRKITASGASYNIAIGTSALREQTGGGSNVAIGLSAMQNNITGANNTTIGTNALINKTAGSNNIAIGSGSGRYHANGSTALLTAVNSIYIGTGARGFNDSDSNAIVIGYNAIGLGSNSIVLGNNSVAKTVLNGNIGIGTVSPTEKLEINGGNIKVTGGSFIDDGTTLSVPDYVFEPNYTFLSLPELEEYLALNFHLPGVPSRDEIKNNGMNYGSMLMNLLEKTEENTLYVLENYKELEKQKDLIGLSLEDTQVSVGEQLTILGGKIETLEEWIPAFARMTDDIIGMTSDIDTIETNLSQLTLDTQQLTTDYTNLELRVLTLETTLAGMETSFELPAEFQTLQTLLLENKIEFDAEGNLKVRKLEAEDVETKSLRVKQDNLIIEASDGNCFRVKVQTDGMLESEAVDCAIE